MKKLALMFLLGGCATAPVSFNESCSNLCQETEQVGPLYAGDSACICKTEKGVRNKLGVCLVNVGDQNACVMQSLLECTDKKLKRDEAGFCTDLEKAVFGASPQT